MPNAPPSTQQTSASPISRSARHNTLFHASKRRRARDARRTPSAAASAARDGEAVIITLRAPMIYGLDILFVIYL